MKNRFNFYVSKHESELLSFLNEYGTGFNQYICNLIKQDMRKHEINLDMIMDKLTLIENNLILSPTQSLDKNNVDENIDFNDNIMDFMIDDF